MEYFDSFKYVIANDVEDNQGKIYVFTYDSIAKQIIKNNQINSLSLSQKTSEIDDESFEENDFINKLLKKFEDKIKNIDLSIEKFEVYIDDYKILYDYINYQKDQEIAKTKCRYTKKTFILKGYVESNKKEDIKKLLDSENLDLYYEFEEPKNDDKVPTKTQNIKVVKPFEFVTNMYSVPNYKELDPNVFVGIFFSLFFGFIMADIGYGIVLTVMGLFFILRKNTADGMRDLMKVIAIGGIFSIVFGLLFGSFFGFTHQNSILIPKAVLPDPSKNYMLYLIGSVAIGMIQIVVSFILKGILCIRRGKIAESIYSAFAWVIFFVGAVLFLLDFAKITSGLKTAGIVVAVSGIAISVFGNVIFNKGFDRLAKSFGSLYSILNLFSDLLSYTRLFGLMLSGVIIASIVNQLAAGFYTSALKIPIGIIISLIGHTFNVAMGALGAYIHDVRLQYIEFFSRFYEGEGELFTPFAPKFSYIKIMED